MSLDDYKSEWILASRKPNNTTEPTAQPTEPTAELRII
jgi:hypothetical protein